MASIQFGVVTDVHYAPAVHGDRHCADSLKKLNAAVATFNERELGLALNLGDSIGGSLNKYAELRFAEMVAKSLAGFSGKTAWVIGNHDVQTMTKPEYLEAIGSPVDRGFYSFDYDGYHFAVLDGNCHEDGRSFRNGDFDWMKTWVAPEQIEWLRGDLASCTGPAIVVCHECLDEVEWKGGLDPHVVGNRWEVRDVIETAGNVRAVLHGHYHYGRKMLINGIPYITFTSLVIGPGLENNAYAIVTLCEDGSMAVEGFGRQPSLRASDDGLSED